MVEENAEKGIKKKLYSLSWDNRSTNNVGSLHDHCRAGHWTKHVLLGGGKKCIGHKNIIGLFKRVTSKKATNLEAAIQKSPAQKESNNTTYTTTLTTTSTTIYTTTYTDGDAPTYANTNEVL